jgi:lipid A 3-O-deacylase
MKRNTCFLLLCFVFHTACAQDHFLRLYTDNDAFVPTNNATDWGYTSGTRIDLFYTTTNKKSFFTWFNKLAGEQRITTKGWGSMQTIIAPQKTGLIVPDKNDYPYAGALVGIHTIHSANEAKKLNLRSEWIVGLMGPPSFGEQTHRFFHRVIKDPLPMGWDHQLPTDLLLNCNVQAEKLLATKHLPGMPVNFIGSAELRSGTMNDGLSAGISVRIGDPKNYFTGLTKQYFPGKGIHVSMSMKISADLVLYNALLEGGLFNKRSPVHDKHSVLGTDRKIQHLTASGEFFLLISMERFALSFQLKAISPELKGYDAHSFGNLSLYIPL